MKDTQLILEIIKELRADASLNYKKEVLARYSDYEPFKEFLIRVYNPRINYYMKKIPAMNYYETKEQSNFTKGYLRTGVYCRPSCYECKFKGYPRISDMTLADFWGIENVDKSMEKNLGNAYTIQGVIGF